MAKLNKSQLGDSWVVNEESEGEISWKEESSASEPDRPYSTSTQKHLPPRKAAKRRSKSPETTTTDPGLIFPTLESHPPKPRNTKPTAQASQLRQRKERLPQPAKMTQRIKAVESAPERRTLSKSSAIETLTGYLLPIMDYFFSILKSALLLLRQPIAWLLCLYLLSGILAVSYNLLTSSIYTALSPICRLPGSSFLPLCSYTPSDPSQPSISASSSADPEFDALMSTHSHFSEILASSSSAVSLPLDMKRSETSIRDLRQIVRFSSLNSRNELVLEFDGFIETARAASYDLQKFNSHVGRTIDIVLSTARWTERVLDDMAFQTSQVGYLPALINKALAPFQPVPFTQARLLDQYITHTRIISDEISNLISEAQALLLVLQNLEDRLDVIHSISLQSQQSAQISKDETLSHLWTLLGGNRAQLSKYDKQLKLLRDVGGYRKIAWAHVTGTLLRLQGMQTELEELRERVGSAEAETLVKKPKDRTPLSVHLEAIRLGVERLEGERERGRELERGHVQRVTGGEGKVLEGGSFGDKRSIDG